ncbi:MAG: S9 family peptidase [Pseudomonadota bacterium]
MIYYDVLKMPHQVFVLTVRRFLLVFFLILSWPIYSKPALEEFGQLPTIRSMSISPDGLHIAFIRRQDHEDFLFVRRLSDREFVGGARLGNEIKARTVYFASNNHVIMLASDTKRVFGYRNVNKLEFSAAFSFSLKTKKTKILLNKTKGLHPAQSGLGKIVGVNVDENLAYMPGFVEATLPPYDLFKVDLKTGIGRRHSRGKHSTIDWFVAGDGSVLAREDYKERDQEHRIYSYIGGKANLVFTQKVDRPQLTVLAVSYDEKGLLFIESTKPEAGVKRLDLETGEITSTAFQKRNNDVEDLRTDVNRKLDAVVYSQSPFYYFLEPNIQKVFKRVDATFENNALTYVDASADKSKMIFKVSGNIDPESYMMFDSDKVTLSVMATGYPDIKMGDIGTVEWLHYDARDGLTIPAVITWPAGIDEDQRKNLPLLVIPHGGPEAYDGIGFDWWAQYFASRGYMILQPNFRGSSGFGREFMLAGRGKWGREMQDDVSDGVMFLTKQGYVDKNRVCIMGASYGGYSALAGGAYTPSIYRCVVAVAGVSDLPRMLADDKRKYGARHWVNSYWRDLVGDSKADRDKLEAISPVNAAASFEAPVLLIHGKDDTVVPLTQSKVMSKALKKAGKDVTLVALKGEDHWLSTSQTRTQTLRKMADFIEQHNPSD